MNMGRRKKEGGIVRKSFTLTEEQAELISYFTAQNQFNSETDFIGWLIESYDAKLDPIKELKILKGRVKETKQKLIDLESQREQLLERIESHNLKESVRKEKTREAIEILKRKIIENEPMSEIERLAKNWAIRLHVDPYELIYRAGKEIKNGDSNLSSIKLKSNFKMDTKNKSLQNDKEVKKT